MKALRKAIRIMCILLAVSLALTAVFFRDNGVEVLGIKSDETLKAQFADTLHSSAEGELQKIASSGFTELYFNSKTSDVAVKEITQNKMWYSMPEGADGKSCIEPVEQMRTQHMTLLNTWRDEAIRLDKRVYVASDGKQWNVSLQNTCMACHADRENFCDKCHNSNNVQPYCWDCHVAPKGNK